MDNLNKILTWQQGFGLLPIHLFSVPSEEYSYIMLNGVNGDFCLNINENENKLDDYHSISWSSNTKNFVVLNNENVTIHNWKKNKAETISQKQVRDNFDKFYQYLNSNSFKSQDDIVPFIIDIFRQFRNLTQEKKQAVEALNLLFTLLTSLEEDLDTLDFVKWGLQKMTIPQNFGLYIDKLKNGRSILKPKLDLIIRHSSGILFQEAQKEVLFFDQQVGLWGEYSNTITSENRRYSSIHYTPPYISRTIVENAIRNLNLDKPCLKIFDPACGSAEFLVEALKQLKEKGYKGEIQIIGWDSSPTAINTSNFLLTYEKRTVWSERLTFEIRNVKDSLQEVWNNNYDLIIMNPPFVSWEQMTDDSRNAVRAVLDSSFIGKPNQASAFFYKSIQSLNDNGIIGCVIPSSLLMLDSYQKLRQETYDLISIDLIGKIGNFVFEDALTDVSLIIAHKPKSNSVPLILWTLNEKGIVQDALRDLRKMNHSDIGKIVQRDYSIYQPPSFPILNETWKTISYQENDLFKNIERYVIENRLVRILDIFNVKQGIRTGKNDIFKISKKEYNELPDKEKMFFKPAVDNESIKGSELTKNNYVWFPYNESGLMIKNERQLIMLANFFYLKKLKPNKTVLKERAGSTEWWSLTRPRNWQYSKIKKLISTEFGKSGSFAFDKDGSFVVERGNAWMPKKEFKNISDYYFYLALFSCTFFDSLLSIYSKQLAGGFWYDLGKKYTGQIPVPNVHSPEIQNSAAYLTLVGVGRELSLGKFSWQPNTDSLLLKYFYPDFKL